MAPLVRWKGQGYYSEQTMIDIEQRSIQRRGSRGMPELAEGHWVGSVGRVASLKHFFFSLSNSFDSSKPIIRPFGHFWHDCRTARVIADEADDTSTLDPDQTPSLIGDGEEAKGTIMPCPNSHGCCWLSNHRSRIILIRNPILPAT